jgi:acyl-CoA-dependent ceramide synthase
MAQLAKMLRYLGYQFACDLMFLFFMISWLYTRHYLFIDAIISTAYWGPKAIVFDWKPEHGHYFTSQVHMGFVALLVSLQVRQPVHSYAPCVLTNIRLPARSFSFFGAI